MSTHHFDAEHVAAALEVEGEAALGLAAEAVALCADHLAEPSVIVDLGCGPGVDTVLLAHRFPTARVIAADGSGTMLARVQARAERLGVADRVDTRLIDLDGELDTLGACDLVWAAMALHHAEDQVATLAAVRGLLRPDGLLCLLERADPMSVRLATDGGRPGLWDRLDAARAAWFERERPALPGALDADRYPDMLAAAGLEIVAARTLAGTVPVADDEATRTALAGRLRASARKFADLADPDDIDALNAMLDGDWHRATVTSGRKLFVATARSTT